MNTNFFATKFQVLEKTWLPIIMKNTLVGHIWWMTKNILMQLSLSGAAFCFQVQIINAYFNPATKQCTARKLFIKFIFEKIGKWKLRISESSVAWPTIGSIGICHILILGVVVLIICVASCLKWPIKWWITCHIISSDSFRSCRISIDRLIASNDRLVWPSMVCSEIQVVLHKIRKVEFKKL